jgi:hypothetical protein
VNFGVNFCVNFLRGFFHGFWTVDFGVDFCVNFLRGFLGWDSSPVDFTVDLSVDFFSRIAWILYSRCNHGPFWWPWISMWISIVDFFTHK